MAPISLIKYLVVLLFLLFLPFLARPSEAAIYNNALDLTVRKTPRWNFPLFGVGVACNGCPPRSCENDPAIIYGYCCGCAKVLDRLPVLCPRVLDCPLNGGPLCHDYEYMMSCCC